MGESVIGEGRANDGRGRYRCPTGEDEDLVGEGSRLVVGNHRAGWY